MQTLDGRALGRVTTETREVFTLRKGDWVAVCNLTSHTSAHGTSWELRLFVGTPDNELMAAYCDSHSEVAKLHENWTRKLRANGWTKNGDRITATRTNCASLGATY